MIDALWLVIESHSCACGQKWTHSQLLLASKEHGLLGGTPSPVEAHKLPTIGYDHWNTINHSACYRCTPLALGEGWAKPQAYAPKPVRPVRHLQSIDTITDELLS